MQQLFFTPGPTQLLPCVITEIETAIRDNILSISHRSKQFEQIFADTVSALRQLLEIPESHSVFFLSSATEAMERIVENCSAQSTYHFVNGAFSQRFFSIASALGRKALKRETPWGHGFDLPAESIPSQAELVCVTQNETSTGAQLNTFEVELIKARAPQAIVAVDVVSSSPYAAIDLTKIDCLFFSVQKLYGMPAGLGVLVVSPAAMARAQELRAAGRSVGSYHSFEELFQFAARNQTPETPNVLGVYLLGKVARHFLSLGTATLRAETEAKAKLLYEFIEHNAAFRPFVAQPFRSKTVICAGYTGSVTALRASLREKGIHVGSGYGTFKDSHIRIANFPMHSQADIARLVEALELVSRG